MAKQDERQKASDVFRDANPVFGEKSSFEEAFPDVEDIRIEVEIGTDGEGNDKQTYTKRNFPGEYIDCSESLCYNGGFSIGSILRDMVRECKTHRQGSEICQGYHGSPKGQRKYKECHNFFQYEVHIEYKENTNEST